MLEHFSNVYTNSKTRTAKILRLTFECVRERIGNTKKQCRKFIKFSVHKIELKRRKHSRELRMNIQERKGFKAKFFFLENVKGMPVLQNYLNGCTEITRHQNNNK